MAQAFIALGSNLGDRQAHLFKAEAELRELPGTHLLAVSSLYDNEPIGPGFQERYLNAVVELETGLPPLDLLHHLQRIEQAHGRLPVEQRELWAPRTLDLDLLMYDQLVIDVPELTLPHRRMHERWFVLKPMTDIAPQAIHPILHRRMIELLDHVCPPSPLSPLSPLSFV